MPKRINHNDLIPWFTMNHADLPPGYLKSCREFFDKIKQTPEAPYKNFFWPTVPQRQASSSKQQASSNKQVTSGPEYDIIKTEREKYENK
jgi:hypothetical protein